MAPFGVCQTELAAEAEPWGYLKVFEEPQGILKTLVIRFYRVGFILLLLWLQYMPSLISERLALIIFFLF